MAGEERNAVAPWPVARRSRQSGDSCHYSAWDQYQSKEELKAVSPDKKMEAKAARDTRAAQKGGRPSSCSQWRRNKQLATKLKAPLCSQEHAKAGRVAYSGKTITYASNCLSRWLLGLRRWQELKRGNCSRFDLKMTGEARL
jgi:hypothetical protein